MTYNPRMISVILNVDKGEAPKLARTLENLVPFALGGFVQEVVVRHDGSDETIQMLAEEAGCNLCDAQSDMQTICADARGDWLLFMEPGATLQAGWDDAVTSYVNGSGGAATFKRGASSDVPWWRRIFFPSTAARRPLSNGLLISKQQARANGGGKSSPEELMRGLALKRLPVGILPA